MHMLGHYYSRVHEEFCAVVVKAVLEYYIASCGEERVFR
jgi:hypothetical protein